MRNFRTVAACALTLLAVSCSKTARISGVLKDAPEKEVVVKLLDVNVYNTLDTVKTGTDGSFACKVPVEPGKPEFVYIFYGERKIASLLLQTGDKVKVEADTLGLYTVEGSEESLKLQQVEQRFAGFAAEMIGLVQEYDAPTLTKSQKDAISSEMTKLFIGHYRECVKYIMTDPKSLTCIPVLYEGLNEYSPVFSQATDALHFRTVCDSLKTVYPESKYVKALEKETVRRENILGINMKIDQAPNSGFPDITLPDTKGNKVSLSSIDSKVILLHFWDASEPTQKMLNLDALMPLYEDYNGKGLEIYAVCVTPDKGLWASVVKAQKLPWINVNDGLGAGSRVLGTYNVTSVPTTYIIADGAILPTAISGVQGLRSEIAKLLK